MKRNVLLVGLLLSVGFTGHLFAQNKTLGVGAASPNPNAVLHIEAPSGNQGFIMPRLTTAQRTASGFQGILTIGDIGLMVFDSDLKEVFTWQGTSWESAGELDLPYVDTLTSAPNNSNLLRLVYAGSATENVGVAQFENLNPNNGFSALFARSNSTTNGAADFVVNNTANNNDAIGVTTNGVGRAGSFTVNNASNANAAIYATTNGTGGITSAAIFAETSTAFSAITARVNAGASNAISGISNSTDPGSYAMLGQNNGAGPGGVFFSKAGTALSGSTQSNVGGALAPVGVYGESTGTGSSAGAFRINNSGNTFSAIYGETNGTGSVGLLKQINTTTFAPALSVISDGQGTAIAGTSSATSTNANAGEFVVQNATNPRNAIFATTLGTGAVIQAVTSTGFTSLYAKRDGATNGNAGLFDITNAANTYPALQANTAGTGAAANFQITNGASTSPAVYGSTNGPGSAFSGDNTSTGDVFAAAKTGASGSAGNFQIINSSNTASAIFAMTNAASGSALGLSNSANGNAVAIFTGGVKVSTAIVTTTSITTRAAAYRITSGGTSFTFGFASGDGEVYMVFNDTGSAITVQGVAIPISEGRTIVNFAGTFRGF